MSVHCSVAAGVKGDRTVVNFVLKPVKVVAWKHNKGDNPSNFRYLTFLDRVFRLQMASADMSSLEQRNASLFVCRKIFPCLLLVSAEINPFLLRIPSNIQGQNGRSCRAW